MGTFFWKKRKTGTIFWKRYIFLEGTIFWQDKVRFSGKGTFFWHSPKRQGRKYGFTYAPLLEMIE